MKDHEAANLIRYAEELLKAGDRENWAEFLSLYYKTETAHWSAQIFCNVLELITEGRPSLALLDTMEGEEKLAQRVSKARARFLKNSLIQAKLNGGEHGKTDSSNLDDGRIGRM